MSVIDHTFLLKQKASELGFTNCRISKAEPLYKEALQLERWLAKDYNGEMDYMKNNFDKRIDPRLLVDGAKSVITFTYNYYNINKQEDKEAPKISMYAYGRDYHKVVKKKLKLLFTFLKINIGDINGRYFVDSAPVMGGARKKHAGHAIDQSSKVFNV